MAALRHVMIQYGIISLKITECHFVDRLMGSFALPMEAITRPGTLQHKRISQHRITKDPEQRAVQLKALHYISPSVQSAYGRLWIHFSRYFLQKFSR